jgi:2-polyprenyl-6-methoxyphenol hydroxylase-like FAD-dependent oxidoreductase
MMSIQTERGVKKAIVIGASMAGLLAARSLADHFEQVVLLERDKFPAPGENRKGVPQGKHTHVLLSRGLDIMDALLPGLKEELVQVGAVPITDVSLQTRWFYNGGYHHPGASGISAIGVSRPTLEALVRKRVLALPNVNAIQECNAGGLLVSATKDRVAGVHIVRRASGNTEEELYADLVVDASGRGSRSPAWLEDLGYNRPLEDEVHVGIGYTSCFYRRKPEQLPGLFGIVFLTTPPDKRMGVMLAQDGDRWVVTIGGYLGYHAPTDHQGFLDAAQKLPAPHIYNLIKDAELLTGPVAYKFPSNLRHRYEKLDRFPQGYMVFGDALCSFNPIYGQGMTVAAMEALALGECLAQEHDELAKNFFARANKIIDASWGAAVGNDLSFPEVEGARTPMTRFINWYISKLHNAAHDDAQVSIAFLKLINMLAPPPSILHPRILWRVIRGNLRLGESQGSESHQVELMPEPVDGKN